MNPHNFEFTAQFKKRGAIVCRITTTLVEPIKNLRFCFSLLDSCDVIRGGTIRQSTGGYCEIKLENEISAETPIELEICYRGHDSKTMNRAWLPLGAYLKFPDGHIETLTPTAAGVIQPDTIPNVPDTGMLRLIPPPTKWQPATGTRIVTSFCADGNSTFIDAIHAVDSLAARNGFSPFLNNTGTTIRVTESEECRGSAYQLLIAEDDIEIQAGDRAGAFYAAITLLNLRATYGGHLPLGTIEDSPRFNWRGQHLDCARHFYQPATLFRLIDIMALLKQNVFHWHFADDEAFRLEIKCHPRAWEKTAYRGEGQTLPGLFGGGAGPYGGSYSIATARELVTFAKQLEIDILPEIEFPAHCFGLARVFPELRDPDDTGTEKSVQSYPQNVINPAIPGSTDFFKDIATEVADIFPFAHIHLGGDELPPGTWDGSPAVAALKASNALGNSQDVMAYAMSDMGEHVVEAGARPCAWEEAGQGNAGGIGNNALLFSWTSQGPGLQAARNGYDVVMCPGQHTYLDMAHTGHPNDWGASWAAIISLTDTVNWDPIPDNEPEIADRIQGVQGTFWSEFTTLDHEMEPMLAPRILGVAAKCWSPKESIGVENIVELAASYGVVFDTIGWNWNRGALGTP